jgi:pantothenate kinase
MLTRISPGIFFMEKEILSVSQGYEHVNRALGERERYVVGIGGLPGSGKSTLAMALCQQLGDVCAVVGMDGFHYPRSYLDTMANPVEAHRRRGAHWTFDADGFAQLIYRLQCTPHETVSYPTFDHAVKDPVMNGLITPNHRIILCEGLYCTLDMPPWNTIQFNERWFFDTPPEDCWSRLVKRHVSSGLCDNEEQAWERIRTNDALNADTIQQHIMDNIHYINVHPSF